MLAEAAGAPIEAAGESMSTSAVLVRVMTTWLASTKSSSLTKAGPRAACSRMERGVDISLADVRRQRARATEANFDGEDREEPRLGEKPVAHIAYRCKKACERRVEDGLPVGELRQPNTPRTKGSEDVGRHGVRVQASISEECVRVNALALVSIPVASASSSASSTDASGASRAAYTIDCEASRERDVRRARGARGSVAEAGERTMGCGAPTRQSEEGEERGAHGGGSAVGKGS
eukprot:scaffold289397_cov30-Tisochrysis_lutea.AAC.1